MADRDDLYEQRLLKATRLEDLGIDPYPAHFHRTHTAARAAAEFEAGETHGGAAAGKVPRPDRRRDALPSAVSRPDRQRRGAAHLHDPQPGDRGGAALHGRPRLYGSRDTDPAAARGRRCGAAVRDAL